MTYNLSREIDVERFLRDVRAFCERKDVSVSLKECKDKRSIAQNCLYWLWLTCIADETGNDKDALHEYFKRKYLGMRRLEIRFEFGCDDLIMLKSTSDLDTKEMTMYLDCIQKFALAECDIALPRPEEQGWQEFYDKYHNFIN